ncbi:MAG TPA: fibronectin type III domain-containing protein [Solirubrobacteraceae bacterium]
MTLPATAVTTMSAAIGGQVNPSGQQTSYTFEYGPSTSFGRITTVVALDDADALEPVSATLSGLTPDTTYYYRVVASNATGTGFGPVLRFSTGPGGLPAVGTGAASSTATGATLAGTVDAHGSQTAFAFEYGTTTGFGSLSAIDSAGDANGAQQITLAIGGLLPGTTYLYRLVATNANGSAFGDVHGVVTPPSDTPAGAGRADATIAAGATHTCAVRTQGHVACWGTGLGGLLGDDDYDAIAPSPVEAIGLTDAVEVAAGIEHTCALRAGGQVDCWGRGRYGQLATGTATTDSTTGALGPEPVPGLTDAVQIAAGALDTCAVRAGGSVVCWGENAFGQLGNATTGQSNALGSNVPVTVAGISDGVQVSVGRTAACAVRSGGQVACWGALGTTQSNVAVAVDGVSDAAQVAVGSGSFFIGANGWACAVRSSGHVVCWGAGAYLGDGGSSDAPSRGPVELPGLVDATQVTANADHTCATRSGGQAVCWGANDHGQIGDGAIDPSFPDASTMTPVAVTGLGDATQIVAGRQYSCALRRGGSAVCWGANGQLQGGNGTSTDDDVPVAVSGLADAGKPPG